MAIAFIQSRSVAGVSLAYTGNVTLNNFLIVVAGDATAGSAVTFAASDTQGNSYTPLAQVSGGVNGGTGQMFYVPAKATGANTVNIATGAGLPQLLIHEFSGLTLIDKFHSASGTGNAIDSGSVSTGQASELLFGFCINVVSLGLSLTPGAGWAQAEILGLAAMTEYQIVSATGAFNATMTTTVSKGGGDNWLAEIATFSGPLVASSGDYWLGGRQHETKIVLPGYAN
jgi:hypothetical protein